MTTTHAARERVATTPCSIDSANPPIIAWMTLGSRFPVRLPETELAQVEITTLHITSGTDGDKAATVEVSIPHLNYTGNYDVRNVYDVGYYVQLLPSRGMCMVADGGGMWLYICHPDNYDGWHPTRALTCAEVLAVRAIYAASPISTLIRRWSGTLQVRGY